MYLPTMDGQWALDNQNIPETDTSLGVHTGDLPLSRLELGKAPTKLGVFEPLNRRNMARVICSLAYACRACYRSSRWRVSSHIQFLATGETLAGLQHS